MEVASYVAIQGMTQGNIEGSCQRRGRENLITVFDFSHSVHLPGYLSEGSSSGSLVHRPIHFCKEVDKSTPKLYQALAARERLTEVAFSWYRFNQSGGEELYYQMLLTNAHIIEVAPWTPPADDKNGSLRFMENVKLTYEHVTWSYGADGEITSEVSCIGE